MRIVLSGIYYPVAILRYFEAALDRLVRDSEGQIEVFKIGHYTGQSIPWKGGMNLKSEYAKPPHMRLPSTENVPFKMIQPFLPWEPDLWLQIVSTNWFIGRPTHGKVFSIGVDPHVIDYTRPRSESDVFFCMQTPYQSQNDVWLPYAYDPVWHAPLNGIDPSALPQKAPDKVYDAALVGMRYPNRDALVNELRARGYNIFYETGPAYFEARAVYLQAKVGLNWSSLLDTTARCFEVMAMGCAGLFNEVPDLMDMFSEGDHFFGFTDLSDAVDRAEVLIRDDHIREHVANAGREAVQGHTYDSRLKFVLGHL